MTYQISTVPVVMEEGIGRNYLIVLINNCRVKSNQYVLTAYLLFQGMAQSTLGRQIDKIRQETDCKRGRKKIYKKRQNKIGNFSRYLQKVTISNKIFNHYTQIYAYIDGDKVVFPSGDNVVLQMIEILYKNNKRDMNTCISFCSK